MHIYVSSKSSHWSVLNIFIFLRSFSENNFLLLSQDAWRFANATCLLLALGSILEILRPNFCVHFFFQWHLPIRIKLLYGVPSILHFLQRKYCTCLSSIEFPFFFLWYMLTSNHTNWSYISMVRIHTGQESHTSACRRICSSEAEASLFPSWNCLLQ